MIAKAKTKKAKPSPLADTKGKPMPREKAKVLPLGHRIQDIITNNNQITFNSALRNNLRTMSALNSIYFTSGDLTSHIKDDYLKPFPELCEKEALIEFCKLTTVALAGMFKTRDHGANAIRRTAGKIAAVRKDSVGSKSFGYRFGAAMAEPTVDKNAIENAKTHSEQYANLFAGGTITDGIKEAMKSFTYDELHHMAVYIQARLAKKHSIVAESLDKFVGERRRKLEEESADLDRALKHK